MSRRSSRLQAKQQQPIIQVKKRKTAQGIKKRKEEVTKKHQYGIRNCWSPVLFTNYRFKNLFINPSPMPDLSWGYSKEVWLNVLTKENTYMRSNLLDWLLEVYEVCTLHRETFYLAQDSFDRFMLTQKDINKNVLQLIGISSLFIASKLEEIYAPKLQEFAYVTDGACSEVDILRTELMILKALKWELCPVIVISWRNFFLQFDALKKYTFIQIAQLLDLCILAVDSLEFQYTMLAAFAICHFTSTEMVKKASGLEWDNISECVGQMVPFASVIKNAICLDIISVFCRYYLALLNEVNYVNIFTKRGQLSPVCDGGIMIPPKSTEKPSGKC
uniref:Cyclin E2 n=1 Tax=Jaculus jaculus TaxID=51337 RepID=A0A8C5KL12_JACJA